MSGRSLRGRLTFLHGSAIGLSMLLFAASAVWVTGHVLALEETRELEQTSRRIGADIEEDLSRGGDLPAVVHDALEEEAASEIRVDVYDSRGDLIGTTGAARPRSTAPGIAPGTGSSTATAARGTGASTATPARGTDQGPRNHARFVSTRGFSVDASVPVAGRRRSMAALVRALALTGVPLLVLVILAERIITTRALRPLEDVTRRADSASAEAGVRSLGEPVGIDEVDRLTAAFNRLLTGLDDARMLERRFAADASHELRTPLTVLLGELELAGSSVPPGTAAAESIASAGAQARRMNDLVDALLLLRRLNEEGTLPAGEFETVNLADVARDVCRAELAARPDRAGDLRLSAPDEIHVFGHPSLLASAMTNLVDNALKFTRRGDAVDVTLEAVDGEVRAVVTDAGGGVPAAEVDRLFDPFFRGSEARAKTQGFGLGLPLLRQVARAHGGDVTYRPAASGGACFVLRLPSWANPPRTAPLPEVHR
jgi:signal transduction histidine kinase